MAVFCLCLCLCKRGIKDQESPCEISQTESWSVVMLFTYLCAFVNTVGGSRSLCVNSLQILFVGIDEMSMQF